MARPVLFVLAGVNGAGKSSVGGHMLRQAGLTWFNPDTFARELMTTTGWDQNKANAYAWNEGMRRLDEAVKGGQAFAFETTLGGKTVAEKIFKATRTHDVWVWFCGLASPDHHIARVEARVKAGGHPIPEETIRARYPQAQLNLISLMPHLAHLEVYDNSAESAPDGPIPDPLLVFEMDKGRLVTPARDDIQALQRAPEWTRALLEAALTSRPPR